MMEQGESVSPATLDWPKPGVARIRLVRGERHNTLTGEAIGVFGQAAAWDLASRETWREVEWREDEDSPSKELFPGVPEAEDDYLPTSPAEDGGQASTSWAGTL